MRFMLLSVIIAALILLSPVLFASSNLDSIFSAPLQTSQQRVNLTLFYPFDYSKVKFTYSNGSLDSDDIYVLTYYNTTGLIASVQNASSISDIYNAVRQFDINLSQEGLVNCQVSTSAFKIAFLNSPLAKEKENYTLMKAFVNDGYDAHRFIILSNSNGNFVIDPLWGMNENLSQSVETNSNFFYNDPSSPNYRGKVDQVSVFFN